jgi:hypothetical protein
MATEKEFTFLVRYFKELYILYHQTNKDSIKKNLFKYQSPDDKLEQLISVCETS